MPDGKLHYYYWRIYSFLAERMHILDVSHKAFQFPDHPHHLHRGEKLSQGKDKIYPLDIPCVDFFTIVSRTEQAHLQTESLHR